MAQQRSLKVRKRKVVVVTEVQAIALGKIEAAPTEYIIGVDEVGLGALAGPVAVGAVVVRKGWQDPAVRDSKQLSAKGRSKARDIILQVALAHVVLEAPNTQVDKYGIHDVRACLTEGAVLYCLRRFPNALIVQDGDVPVVIADSVQNMVWMPKADELVPAVSAASILAKLHRDAFMLEMHKAYPHYAFSKNMGYGTKSHFEGLKTHGACPLHRASYKPVRESLARGVGATMSHGLSGSS